MTATDDSCLADDRARRMINSATTLSRLHGTWQVEANHLTRVRERDCDVLKKVAIDLAPRKTKRMTASFPAHRLST